MPIAPTTETLRLADFRMAGFLIARGCMFAGTDTNARGDVIFLFKPGEGLPDPHHVLTQYPMSEEWRYDAACRSMHDFVKLQQAKMKHGR